jgi:hypothetical protein
MHGLFCVMKVATALCSSQSEQTTSVFNSRKYTMALQQLEAGIL